MEKKMNLKFSTLIFVVPLAVFSLAFFLVFGNCLSGNPDLVMAMALDLMITAPLLYFLLIRKTSIPNFTAVSIFIIGTLIVSFVLPKESVPELNYIENILLPLMEISVFSYLIFRGYKMRKEFLVEKGNDALSIIKKVTEKSLGVNIYSKLFTTEIAFTYYGLLNWKKVIPKENEFTYHIKSGLSTIFGVLIFVLLIESVAMHFLLAQWNEIVAWILTIGSIYAIFQITAHVKACSRRLISVGENKLKLKYGLFGDVDIDYDNINKIELSRQTPKEKDGLIKLALVDGLEVHNIILYLNENITISGAYGMKKRGSVLLIHVDDKERFFEEIENKSVRNS